VSEAPRHVAIVGASVAGVNVAKSLRRFGYEGDITIICDEPHLPYDRPPLSKQALYGDDPLTVSRLADPDFYPANGVRLRLGAAASALDPVDNRIALSDGGEVAADVIVIATGALARRLPADMAPEACLTLRTLDDSLALRQRLRAVGQVAIIGGGFIGAEVASSALRLGLLVTVIDADPQPMARFVGDELAPAFGRIARDAGLVERYGVSVASVADHGSGVTVALGDGSRVDADLLVVGVGSEPNTGWLTGSGLELCDGVRCDESGATNRPDVYAAGDVASWWDPAKGRHIRQEHWTSATEQATLVSARILRVPDARPRGVPYFWSDQFGNRLQVLGATGRGQRTRVTGGSLDGDSFVAYFEREGVVAGAVALNAPAAMAAARRHITERTGWRESETIDA
jgi:3-phenylpropionate/trans-cinnamate dioxygenase ferredoxin reductase subunit